MKQGDPLVIVESMKMEIHRDGALRRHASTSCFCREGGQVAAGQDLLVLVSE